MNTYVYLHVRVTKGTKRCWFSWKRVVSSFELSDVWNSTQYPPSPSVVLSYLSGTLSIFWDWISPWTQSSLIWLQELITKLEGSCLVKRHVLLKAAFTQLGGTEPRFWYSSPSLSMAHPFFSINSISLLWHFLTLKFLLLLLPYSQVIIISIFCSKCIFTQKKRISCFWLITSRITFRHMIILINYN